MRTPAMGSSIQRLEELLQRAGRSNLSALPGDELLELGRTYRQAGALLARARTAGLKGPDVERLNRLVARAYPLVHARPPSPRGARVFQFVAREFPRVVRQEWRPILIAAGVLLFGMLTGILIVTIHPDAPDFLLGAGWKEALDQVAERHLGDQDWLPEIIRPAVSVMIMINNIKVAFFAFASGVLLCLGSVYVMGLNGLLLGAVAVVVHRHSSDASFWAFILPHGVMEISAIIISGGAGLILGYALINPGRLYRLTALRQAARRAIPLLMGVVLMLVLAGLIEGFFSPLPHISPGLKIGFALLTLVCLATWLGGAGREEVVTAVPSVSSSGTD